VGVTDLGSVIAASQRGTQDIDHDLRMDSAHATAVGNLVVVSHASMMAWLGMAPGPARVSAAGFYPQQPGT
jgi:hypothetical protein